MQNNDYYNQALRDSEESARRYRDRQAQEQAVRSAFPQLAKANPEGLKQHAAGLYASLGDARQDAPGAVSQPRNMTGYQFDGQNQQLSMLEQQSSGAGFGTAADIVNQQSGAFGGAQPAAPERVLDAGAFGGDKGVFVNTAPPSGFGQAIYSDSRQGAEPGAFAGRGNIVDPGSGPFGRTAEEQQRISDRVRQYQSAIDLMRSLRGIPTERDRLNARATQRISLNQGIGAFANQAADRNYAREQLTQLDAREAASAKGAFDAGQAQIKNAFEAQKLQQDRYKVTDPRYDSFGNQVAPGAIFDTRNGEYVNQPGGGAFQGQQPIGEAYAVNPDTGERIRYDHAKQEWVKAE